MTSPAWIGTSVVIAWVAGMLFHDALVAGDSSGVALAVFGLVVCITAAIVNAIDLDEDAYANGGGGR